MLQRCIWHEKWTRSISIVYQKFAILRRFLQISNVFLKFHENCWFVKQLFCYNIEIEAVQKVCESCKSWKPLKNACILAKFGFEIAENEPAKNLQKAKCKMLLILLILLRSGFPAAGAGRALLGTGEACDRRPGDERCPGSGLAAWGAVRWCHAAWWNKCFIRMQLSMCVKSWTFSKQ